MVARSTQASTARVAASESFQSAADRSAAVTMPLSKARKRQLKPDQQNTTLAAFARCAQPCQRAGDGASAGVLVLAATGLAFGAPVGRLGALLPSANVFAQ